MFRIFFYSKYLKMDLGAIWELPGSSSLLVVVRDFTKSRREVRTMLAREMRKLNIQCVDYQREHAATRAQLTKVTTAYARCSRPVGM